MPKKFSGSQVRRAAMNMKTTEELRSRLEQAAAASGRALTHEIEHRIERSFQEDELRQYRSIKEGDDATRDLGESLALTIGMLNRHFGENWRDSYAARQALVKGVQTVLGGFFARNPLPAPGADEEKRAAEMEGTAGFLAKMWVGVISHDPSFKDFVERWGEALENPEEMERFQKSLPRSDGKDATDTK